MKEAGGVLGGGGHAKLAYIHGVDGRDVDAAALAYLAEQSSPMFDSESLEGQQGPQERVGAGRMDFGHEITQELRLRGVVRGVLVDAQKTHHAVDQVVEGGAEVGWAVVIIIASPTGQAEAVVFVFFQWCGVEDAENIFAVILADLDGFDVIAGFSGGTPVEGIDVLQNGKHGFRGKLPPEQGGQRLGREVRLAEQHNDKRIRMAVAEIGNLVCGVPVTSADFAPLFARHAIEPVNGGAVVAGGGEQFVKWSPFVSPVEFEADALAQFAFINFAAEPFVENVLVAGENGFDSQHHGSLVKFGVA